MGCPTLPTGKKIFEEWFPYDFITEGHDQTRGWFYSQLGCGVISLNRSPYKKVLMHGFTLDEEGRKMSKSLGNVIEPDEVIGQYGADILRFYLLWGNKPWEDLKFTWKELKNVSKMFNILWNVYVFSTTYMAIDNFNPTLYTENDLKLRDEDKWITSRVNSIAKEVAKAIDSLHLHKATRAINHFILEDLSRWYIRLIRGRTWVEKEDPDKLGAYFTLYNVLKLLVKIMAPITPHITEEIYQNLVKGVEDDAPESVHMEDWKFNEDSIDTELEKNIDIVRDIIEACARGRDIAKYKLRWPVKEIVVVSEDKNVLNAVKSLKVIIMEQANTKEITATDEFKNLKIIAKPNLKTIGPKFRGDAPKIMKHLSEADGAEIKLYLDTEGTYLVEVDDRSIELDVEDILFETELPKNLISANFDSGNVFINIEITDEILSEAMSRELIRRIQDMRKDLDLDVEANIQVFVECDESFKELITPFLDFISQEVRADRLSFETQKGDYIKEWKIEDKNLRITIKKDTMIC